MFPRCVGAFTVGKTTSGRAVVHNRVCTCGSQGIALSSGVLQAEQWNILKSNTTVFHVCNTYRAAEWTAGELIRG